jgi:hypothetical protein
MQLVQCAKDNNITLEEETLMIKADGTMYCILVLILEVAL